MGLCTRGSAGVRLLRLFVAILGCAVLFGAHLLWHSPLSARAPRAMGEQITSQADTPADEANTPAVDDAYSQGAAMPQLAAEIPKPVRARFAPGSLDLPRHEVVSQCYSDPERYKKHFNSPTAGPHMGEGFCARSDNHRLMYFHIPKSGSSTGRHAMLDIFQGEDNQRCVPTDTQRWPSYKKVAVVREPTDRFYAGYDEWFARRLSKKHTIPSNVRAVSEGIPDYKAYEALFLSPELTRRYEMFVERWDGLDAFDDHIRMQAPTLSNWRDGLAYPMDFVGETAEMETSWATVGAMVGKTVDLSQVRQGRSFPRRFNTTAISPAARRRVCQLLALDYCCLNFPLPQPCDGSVQCKWTHRSELPQHHSTQRTWFIEPVLPGDVDDHR